MSFYHCSKFKCIKSIMPNIPVDPHDPNRLTAFATLQHSYSVYIRYFWSVHFETTIDICKFPWNYSLLPFHNGVYRLLASTSSSYDRNTCAEVTAFTPTTTHPPLQSRTKVTNTCTYPVDRITSVRLACSISTIRIQQMHMCMCVWVCISCCLEFPLYGRCWTEVFFFILHFIQSHRSPSQHCCSVHWK